jgi:hypothetical protein
MARSLLKQEAAAALWAARCRNTLITAAVPWVDKYYFASPR